VSIGAKTGIFDSMRDAWAINRLSADFNADLLQLPNTVQIRHKGAQENPDCCKVGETGRIYNLQGGQICHEKIFSASGARLGACNGTL
jgi:hypothetical protein